MQRSRGGRAAILVQRRSLTASETRPSVLLGRLAVDRDHQGKGLAAALLKHFLLKALEVAALTGVRLVLVHARDPQAAGFYRHFGFEPSPMDDLTLMLLLKDIRT